MEYRTLGRTGVQVSSLCFGTMSFGGDADEATSAAMFHRCRQAGINFFDCANVYNKGRSEEILGGLIAESRCRDEVIITSKVHFPTGPDVNARGTTRRHIMRQVEGSLKRLGADWLDIYFLHGWDAKTPIDEPLRALDDLVRQGKILYPGVSNWAAWQIAKALGISTLRNLARFECVQPMYNLVKRQAEVEILPMVQSEQLGVISYSPLGGGLLTGKFGVGKRPEAGRLTSNTMYQVRYGDPANLEVADRLQAYAESNGQHPATLAIAWVMAHPGITAAIIGARNLEQLEPSLQAAELQMTPEWRAEISALSIEPAVATDRTEERQGTRYQGVLAR